MNSAPTHSPGNTSKLPASLRHVLALGAWWVPRSRRRAWRREWEAELYFAARSEGDRPRRRLLRRALWSHLDALWIFQEELTMTRLLADVRLAVRSLQRSPLFAGVAVLTLALGIGANAAIFSVVNGVLLKPLAYPDADDLLSVNFQAPGLGYPLVPFSEDFYLFMAERQHALESLGMYNQESVNLVGDGDPVRIGGSALTPSVFDVLRVPAALGRTLTASDAEPGAEPVAVIAHELWQERYGGDPNILERTEDMDGVLRRVVGVMPAGFTFPGADTRVWRPLLIDPADLQVGSFSHPGIGRLTPGMTIAEVVDDLDGLMVRLFEEQSDNYPMALVEQAEFAPLITSLKEVIVGDVRQALWVILGTVGAVLLIACANVANLFLVRAETRQREVTLRAALGAGRGDIARFFLAESMILSLAGGALGVALAAIAVNSFVSLAPVAIPRLSEIGIDARVLGFTLLISLGAGLLFGIVPLLRRQLRNLATSLREGGRSVTTAQGRFSARNVLVVAQVAMALVLLVGSGLMMRSFQALRTVDPGFVADGVLTVEIALPGAAYPGADERVGFWRAALEAASALPGVTSAGIVDYAPMGSGRSAGGFAIEEFPTDDSSLPPLAEKRRVLPGYFETMGIPLVAGRYPAATDGARDFRAAVVSQSLVQHWWPDGGALGKRIRENDEEEWFEIVGVVGNVHQANLEDAPEETIYYPALAGSVESPHAPGRMTVVLRTAGSPSALVGPMRSAIATIDPRMPLARSEPMAALLGASMARTSFTLVMLAIASSVALLLGAIGIYGVISYVVNQRTQEIGVRLALGASRRSVQSMVVRRGMTLATVGIAIGTVGALATSSALSSLLYEIDALDPLTYAAVAMALAVTALFASWLPALRASGVDPIVALRSE